MKKGSFLLALFLLVSVSEAYAQGVLPIKRGVNLTGLEAPLEGSWGVVIKDEYFELVKEAGFDHVRIPIRWNAHSLYESPYTIKDYIFERVDHLVSEAFKNDLYVVINIHHFEEMMKEPEKYRDKFIALWEQIADHYQDYPESLWFELLNEPCMNLNSNLWNDYLKEAIEVIRKTNPDRKIVVGPADWNNINRLKDLKLPQGDENIVVTFHYYNPFNFTHQGAEWVSPSPPVGVKWSGSEEEKKAVERELDIAAEWSRDNGDVPLWMGEFGAYSKADLDSRARWTEFVARSAEKRNIAWAYWDFASAGFGVYDYLNKIWQVSILKALILETKI